MDTSVPLLLVRLNLPLRLRWRSPGLISGSRYELNADLTVGHRHREGFIERLQRTPARATISEFVSAGVPLILTLKTRLPAVVK
jgi:hypothetical protein